MTEVAYMLDGEPAPYVPQCSVCQHLIDNPTRICRAFPKGIPFKIWSGEFDHVKSWQGDMGYRFVRSIKKLTSG